MYHRIGWVLVVPRIHDGEDMSDIGSVPSSLSENE